MVKMNMTALARGAAPRVRWSGSRLFAALALAAAGAGPARAMTFTMTGADVRWGLQETTQTGHQTEARGTFAPGALGGSARADDGPAAVLVSGTVTPATSPLALADDDGPYGSGVPSEAHVTIDGAHDGVAAHLDVMATAGASPSTGHSTMTHLLGDTLESFTGSGSYVLALQGVLASAQEAAGAIDGVVSNAAGTDAAAVSFDLSGSPTGQYFLVIHYSWQGALDWEPGQPVPPSGVSPFGVELLQGSTVAGYAENNVLGNYASILTTVSHGAYTVRFGAGGGTGVTGKSDYSWSFSRADWSAIRMEMVIAVFEIAPTPVPEPATSAMALLGLAPAALARSLGRDRRRDGSRAPMRGIYRDM
jgi:hypothetical protein